MASTLERGATKAVKFMLSRLTGCDDVEADRIGR